MPLLTGNRVAHFIRRPHTQLLAGLDSTYCTGRAVAEAVGLIARFKDVARVPEFVGWAKLNAHDPHAYLKDVLTRLPTHMNSRIDELLPHRWSPA